MSGNQWVTRERFASKVALYSYWTFVLVCASQQLLVLSMYQKSFYNKATAASIAMCMFIIDDYYLYFYIFFVYVGHRLKLIPKYIHITSI